MLMPMHRTSRCYIPSYMEIGPPVPENKIGCEPRIGSNIKKKREKRAGVGAGGYEPRIQIIVK